MPQMPVYATLSSTGVRIVNMDYNKPSPFNASVGATFSSTTGSMTATYSVEFTQQDAQLIQARGSTQAVVWVSDATLGTSGITANGTSTYTTPIAALRFTLSAVSSGSVTFSVLQG